MVALELAQLDSDSRDRLESELSRLAQVPEVRWFRLSRDAERPSTTAFLAVVRDLEALVRYRVDPIHLEVAEAIRQSAARVHRLDLDDMPLLQ